MIVMRKGPILAMTVAPFALAACTPQGDSTPMSGSTASMPAEAEPVYVLRVPARRDAAAPLARFEGRYEVVGGCLAFMIGGTPHLPALVEQGDARQEGNTVTIGTRTIELGKTITPGGSALDPYDFARAAESPPAACADWPRIRI
jgi:hypothetical protein